MKINIDPETLANKIVESGTGDDVNTWIERTKTPQGKIFIAIGVAFFVFGIMIFIFEPFLNYENQIQHSFLYKISQTVIIVSCLGLYLTLVAGLWYYKHTWKQIIGDRIIWLIGGPILAVCGFMMGYGSNATIFSAATGIRALLILSGIMAFFYGYK